MAWHWLLISSSKRTLTHHTGSIAKLVLSFEQYQGKYKGVTGTNMSTHEGSNWYPSEWSQHKNPIT
jgi:hypothetical protein